MHAVQIIAENKKLSSAAYERSRDGQPRLDFHPPDGPMDAIALPEVAAEQRVAGKYHVVLTADGTLYGEWTTLVCCLPACGCVPHSLLNHVSESRTTFAMAMGVSMAIFCFRGHCSFLHCYRGCHMLCASLHTSTYMLHDPHSLPTLLRGRSSAHQLQANYHTYKRAKAADPNGPMGGYTRVLHADAPDRLMHFIPTVLVRQQPDTEIFHYAPMMRPWALCQFLARVKIPEDYILMTEPDHIFLRAPPLDAELGRALLYPFSYARCTKHEKAAAQCSQRKYNEKGVPPDKVPGVRRRNASSCPRSSGLGLCCLCECLQSEVLCISSCAACIQV